MGEEKRAMLAKTNDTLENGKEFLQGKGMGKWGITGCETKFQQDDAGDGMSIGVYGRRHGGRSVQLQLQA